MKPVLYAEDDRNDVLFLEQAWEQAQILHPLFVVPNGQAAMDYLAGHGQYADRVKHPFPCLLLLDLKMPIRGGFEVLQWVRQQRTMDALRVVILSGSEQDSDLVRARNLGVVDYVVKPGVPARLVEIVQKRKSLWLGTDSDE